MRKITFLFFALVLLCLPALAQNPEWTLSETLDVNLGTIQHFTINYPAGWQTFQQGRNIMIAQLGEDIARGFTHDSVSAGYVIYMERFGIVDLRELGINTSQTSFQEGLSKFGEAMNFTIATETTDTTFLTWPAITMRTRSTQGNDLIVLLEYRGMEASLIRLLAPTGETLDDFLPTWDAILASMQFFSGAVWLGDHNRMLDCVGEGSPTVLLEPDLDSNMWTPVMQARIAEFTRVCIYNRPAYGDVLHTFDDFSRDTRNMLATAGIEPPYILVGHNIGGQFANMFATIYPDEVAGLLLVDSYSGSAYEQQFEFFADSFEATVEEIRQADQDYIANYGLDWSASLAEEAAITSLGDLPLLVFAPELCFPGTEDEMTLRWHQTWLDQIFPKMATLSTNGSLIILEGVNHNTIISLVQQEVLDGIQQVVEQAH